MADAGENPGVPRDDRAVLPRTPGARRLRARTPQSRAEVVGQIIRHREDLAACRQSGDLYGALVPLAALADAYRALGRSDEAMALLSDPAATPDETETGDPVWVRAALATVNLVLGRAAEAKDLYRAMQTKCEEKGDQEGVTYALVGQADACQALGRTSEAQSLRETASRITAQLDAAADADDAPDPGSRPDRQRSAPVRVLDLPHVTTLHPRTYNEARVIGEHLRDGTPVIMDLTEMLDNDAKRLVDFAAGLIFGLHGSIDRVADRVFLICPADVEVTAEDRAQSDTAAEDKVQARERESFGWA